MGLTASAGNATASIKPNRPSWADMKLHYPAKDVSIDILYNAKIKGGFLGKEDDKYFANTCAIRMSYALLRSGFSLHEIKSSILGGDKKWYWTTVVTLRAELIKRFKGFDAELRLDLLPPSAGLSREELRPFAASRKQIALKFLETHLYGKRGIVAFKVSGWETATGHFTLWDGHRKELAYAPGQDDPGRDSYYFWLTTTDPLGLGQLVQVTHIQFWELK